MRATSPRTTPEASALNLTLELSLQWESRIARHCDRYVLAGLDPQESDLPGPLAGALEKVDAGGAASVDLPAGKLTAHVIARDDAPAAGYLPALFALKNGIAAQADLDVLGSFAEPYARPHADDAVFYAAPRLVNHLDLTAQASWRAFTGRFVQDGMQILDLMASCDSHLPASTQPASVTGIGMNAAELASNPALTERIVHDLNINPTLPCPDRHFDLALCALSIEYLTRPEAVLANVRRCLKPGAVCVVSFSERWFPPKAVAPWPMLTPFARVAWVLRHLRRAGFANLHTESLRGLPRPRDDKYFLKTELADPLYAVWGSC